MKAAFAVPQDMGALIQFDEVTVDAEGEEVPVRKEIRILPEAVRSVPACRRKVRRIRPAEQSPAIHVDEVCVAAD